MVVARTEAFIAGWGLEEAILRATAYAESGADIILCHSKRKDSADILSFMEHWSGIVPVVIVPTKYPTERISSFVEHGVTNFIFANHSLRTVITALQKNLRQLKETSDLMSIENEIVPVSEIFRLQNVAELKASEEAYLPDTAAGTRSLVLAATKGDFGELTAHKPKTMLYLHGKPILSWHMEAFRRQGIKEIGVVRGYCKEAVNLAGLRTFDNDAYAETGELASLHAAMDFLKGDLVIAYGDIIFDDFILQNLINHGGEIKIAVDVAWKLRNRSDRKLDLVSTSGADSPMGDNICTLATIGDDLPPEQAHGEWIGLLHLRADKTARFAERLERLSREDPELFKKGDLPTLLNLMVSEGEKVTVVHSFGHWRDLDEEKDLVAARTQTPRGT